MTRIELEIGGMSCQHCVKTVRGLLEALPGVEGLEVEVGKARLSLPAAPSPEDLGGLLDDAGFDLKGYRETGS